MGKKKILVVDDDEDTQILLKKRLQAVGYDCVCVSTVESAMETFSTVRPDLVLLDLMFRGPNGTAFLQKVKQDSSGGKATPVLVLSGCNEEEVVKYVLENGASGFIKKPINPETILSMINEYIS